MGRVVLATMGSWGDIFPVVGLAKGLSAAGHQIRIAASPAYLQLVESEGLNFAAIGPRLDFADYAADPKILSDRMGGFAGFAHLFRRFIFPSLSAYVDDLANAIDGADLLLSHPAMVAGPVAAEHAGIPWGTISVFPGLIPTIHAPPTPARISLGAGTLGRVMHRGAWAAARTNLSRLFDKPVNRERRRVGLRPVSDSFFWPVESGRPYLVMASPTVIQRPPDWPANVALTGFVAWDQVRVFPPPSGLDEFLGGGDPPVLVTLGASSSLDPHGFYSHAAAAVNRLGHRALILTGPTPAGAAEPASGDRVMTVPYAPLSLVAPRCRAAIHHGGVGTTVGVLAAGLPQLVVPRAFDQPQTAVWLARLGVARSLGWRRATATAIARALTPLLSDPGYRRHASVIGERLAAEDGLAQTVRAVQDILGR